MKKPKLKYGVPSNVRFLIRDMAAVYPKLVVFICLEAVLSVVAPVISLYIPKLTLDLVTAGASAGRIALSLGGAGLAMTLIMAASGMAGNGKYMMYNAMRMHYIYRLFSQSLDCDYEHIESPAGQTKYRRAFGTLDSGDASGTSRMTVAMIDIFVASASFIVYSGIISTLNPLVMAVLVGLSLVNLFAVKRAQRYEYSRRDDTTRLSKQMSYVERTANDYRWGKDIRLYGMGGWLIDIWEHILSAYTAVNRKIQQRYFAAGTVNALTLFLRDGLAYAYLIHAATAGDIGIGSFVLYFGAITGFSGFVSRIIDDVNSLNDANLKMNDLRAFLDNTDTPEPENPAHLPSGSYSVVFDHVWFSYSEDSEPVLSDFSMSLAAGEKAALVGVNGAGKTTIVKLLCGFYKPSRGSITINGVDIGKFSKKELFSAFSAVFQDVFILPFTVAENVSMTTLESTDLGRVRDCLEKAGLYEAIEKYPKGVREYMTKSVEDGIVLSGGQQQKLLMARALYKDGPVLILDEPTAALDPIAESETYESFHALSLDKTALYISHRLASTRFCDKVVLINGGRATEVGTHEELLALGGEYAKMYEVQSHYYRTEGENA